MRTAGEIGSWLLIGGALAWACVTPEEPEVLDETLEGYLVDIGEDVPRLLGGFRSELVELQTTLGEGDKDGARLAWASAMQAWQVLELYQIGPAASSLTARAGQSLRDEIYSWPTVNPCRVDQETVEGAWDDPGFFTDNLPNSYGLDAVEHLLFAGPDTVCPSEAGLDADWAALGPEQLDAHRMAYALAATGDLLARTDELLDAWSPEGGDFAALLAAPGSEGSPYETPTQALNAVYDAVYYLELVTKDRKLAQPLGLLDCDGTRCPDAVESRLSGTALAWIEANSRSFDELFSEGLEAVLVDRGHADVAEALRTELDDLLAVAEAQAALDLEELIVDDPAVPEQLYAELKGVTDLLKGDVATVLSLRIPSEGSGDND